MQNLWHIVVPLAKPIMTSVMLIVFVNTWNEFLFSNTFLQKEEMRTVSLRFLNFVGKNGADYGYIYAAAIISILPIIIIILFDAGFICRRNDNRKREGIKDYGRISKVCKNQ